MIGDSRDARGDEIGGNALERILNITGQDGVQVNRKNLSMFSATLATRFVVLSNALPRVTDTSGAFVSRIILLHFKESFENLNDTKLLEKLLAELPGILNWAIAGLQRHRERGRFLQPTTGAAKLQLVQAGASPITEFIADRCRVRKGLSVTCRELLDSWKRWCEENNRDKPGTAQTLGIKLASVPGCSNIERKKITKMGERVWCYVGIGIRDIFDSVDEKPSRAPDKPIESAPARPDQNPIENSGRGILNILGNQGVISERPDCPDFFSSQLNVGDPATLTKNSDGPSPEILLADQKVGADGA